MSNPGPGTNRRLATIMFADVDGYGHLMRADEEQTLVALRAQIEMAAAYKCTFKFCSPKTID